MMNLDLRSDILETFLTNYKKWDFLIFIKKVKVIQPLIHW